MTRFFCMVVPVSIMALIAGQSALGQPHKSAEVDVVSPVAGTVTVGFLRPEGARVAKGDLVCELVFAPRKEDVASHKFAVRKAEIELQKARLTRELAEITVREYPEGVYKQDYAAVDGEVKLAESDRIRAEDRLEWSAKMLEKGFVSRGQNISDMLTLQRAKFSLEQARTKRAVLEKYTKEKTLKDLTSEVEKAHSEELASQAKWDATVAMVKDLTRQAEACKIVAPVAGKVTYPRAIDAAAVFHKGVVIFRIAPDETEVREN